MILYYTKTVRKKINPIVSLARRTNNVNYVKLFSASNVLYISLL